MKKIPFPRYPDVREIKIRGFLSVIKEKRAGKEYNYPSIRIKDKELVKLLPREFTFSVKIPRSKLECKGNKSDK